MIDHQEMFSKFDEICVHLLGEMCRLDDHEFCGHGMCHDVFSPFEGVQHDVIPIPSMRLEKCGSMIYDSHIFLRADMIKVLQLVPSI